MTTYELKELNLEMGRTEYEMLQDIPKKESGSTNDGYGIGYADFHNYLEKQIKRRFNKVDTNDTPTIMCIMYVNDYPVGLIGLRTEINEQWKRWSGNFYYVIRKSERGKGYGTKILELGLKKLKEMGITEVFGQSSAGNIGSAKVIENNGGILIGEDKGTRYYKIDNH